MILKLVVYLGSMDPYQRAPRSPRGKKAQQPFDGSNPTLYTNLNDEGARSPTSDQVCIQVCFDIFLSMQIFQGNAFLHTRNLKQTTFKKKDLKYSLK